MEAENHYKQLWRNIRALNLPVVEFVEHWVWKTAAWRRFRDFNVNTNNDIKAMLNRPLGPPVDVMGQNMQVARKRLSVSPSLGYIVILKFG